MKPNRVFWLSGITGGGLGLDADFFFIGYFVIGS